ncbi:MAG: hypothetical protein LRY71_11220 [Bacillaceae bacterium]|nr:hypothetical protein [Bacillaceae bacterium]
MSEKLLAESSGILNWAVEGFRMWQQEGLNDPRSIIEATDSYRQEMDILYPFIVAQCDISPYGKIEAKTLYEYYLGYCNENNETPLKKRKFIRTMEIRGFKKFNGAQNKLFFEGVTLKSDAVKYKATS